MEPEGQTLGLLIIATLPVILAVFLVGLFFLIRIWQRTSESNLKLFFIKLRLIQAEHTKLFNALQPYAGFSEEPYHRLAEGMAGVLGQTQDQLVFLIETYAEVRTLAKNRRYNVWRTLISAPVYWFIWFQIHQRTKTIRHELDNIGERLDETAHQIAYFESLPAQTALRLEKMTSQAHGLLAQIDDMHTQKFSGDTFQEEVEALRYINAQLQENLSRQKSDQNIELQSPEMLSRVSADYTLLERVKPEIDRLAGLFSIWERQFLRASKQVNSMQAALQHANQELAQIGSNMDAGPQAAELRSLNTIAVALSETIQRAEVENLAQITDEARRVGAAARSLSFRLEHAPELLANFSTGLQALRLRQRILSDQVSGLATSEQLPVNFEKRQLQLMEISNRLSQLSKFEQKPALDNLDQILPQLSELEKAQRLLQRDLDLLAEQKAEILSLITGKIMRDFPDWLQHARELVSRATVYPPDNWPIEIEILLLPELLESLDLNFHLANIGRSDQSISETKIPETLKHLRHFQSEYLNGAEKISLLKGRLEQLLAKESGASEQLQLIQANFQQMIWVVNSNPLLQEKAGGQISKLSQRLESLKNSIRNKSQGIIDVKAGQVDQIYDSIRIAGEGWIQQLDEDLSRLAALIEKKYSRVTDILNLQDPVVDRMEKLLKPLVLENIQSEMTGTNQPGFDHLISSLKQRNDLWQERSAAMKEFDELIEKPVIDAFTSAHSARKQAFELVAQLREFQSTQQWPPTTIDFEVAIQLFARIEADWEKVQQAEMRAIWAVRRLGELTAEYRSWCTQVGQSLSWAKQDRERIYRLEGDFQSAMKAWREKEELLVDNPILVAQVRQLRARMNQALDNVKLKLHVERGEKSAEDLYHEVLNDLTRLVDQYQQAIVEGNDINGKQHRIRTKE